MKLFLLFPHQLFEEVELLKSYDQVYLVEEYLFFKQYPFHQQKIWLHRASMKYYEQYLVEQGISVQYIEATNASCDIRNLLDSFQEKKIQQIDYYDPTDHWLQIRIQKGIKHLNLPSTCFESPNFLNPAHEVRAYIENRKKILHHDFYVWQRKKWNILLDGQQPLGGKWSFDAENRKKYPANKTVPRPHFPAENKYGLEAKKYVITYFSDHYGKLDGPIPLPCTHAEAKEWLADFIENRLEDFGIYEDAMVKEEVLLNHSLLSPLLNIGLLSPQEIINALIKRFKSHQLPLNTIEGIVRQIIGWREFMRAVYLCKGSAMRTKNFWNLKDRNLNGFYDGSTGIEPIDTTIKRILATGYCHHIERLMVLGNFMLLARIHPDAVYQWFMEMFIDAYDWVMVPNVYAMSQYADGGTITTKPYISSSNYLLKMSDYKSKEEWTNPWDALYWLFIDEHRDFFMKNPRLQFSVNLYDKFSSEKKNKLQETALAYFQRRV